MAKITRHGGVSDRNNPTPKPQKPKRARVTVDTTQTDERLRDLMRQWVRVDGGGLVADVPAAADETPTDSGVEVALDNRTPHTFAAEGGEEPSPGISSSTSSESATTSSAPSKPARRKPARTTGNRSRKGQTGSNSASSTVGGPTEPMSDPDDPADG